MPRKTEPPPREQTANLAAEFLVASYLIRLGYVVTLTLGQTKEIDLIAIGPRGRSVTIDVKGLKNKTNWPMRPVRPRRNHFFIFVSFLTRFHDLAAQPDVFIVPSSQLSRVLGRWTGRPEQRAVAYRRLRDSRFRSAWDLMA